MVLLTGCTINVVDKRLTPEGVGAAFTARDNALTLLASELKKLQDIHKKELDKYNEELK